MRLPLTLVTLCAAANANAQDRCANYVGQVIAPRTIQSVLAPLSQVGARGGSETPALYEARRAAAVGQLTGPLIIGTEPFERDRFFEYDSRRQRLKVISRVFIPNSLNATALFGIGQPYYGLFDPGILFNYGAVVEQSDRVTGATIGYNSYGTAVPVNRVLRTTRGIFERAAEPNRTSVFPNADGPPYVAGEIAMTPADAERLKPLLKLAWVVEPRPPFLLSATYRALGATTYDPRDVTEEISVVIGDMQCGLVLDPANVVLGAFATR